MLGALLHEQYSSSIVPTVTFNDWLLETRQVLAKQFIMDSIKVRINRTALTFVRTSVWSSTDKPYKPFLEVDREGRRGGG